MEETRNPKESPTQTVVLHPLIGKTLKQYRVDGFLGQGGMGVAYRAHDLKLQRPVALKILSATLTADPDRHKRFLLEARAAARISHPAIAQVFDVDEQEGTTFIAMELVEGKTVRELIRGKELDLLGAIDIAIQVAEGLAKAHDMGIVHRDIKPANVILSRDGHAKILDFGLAKLLDPGAATITPADPATDLSTLTQTQLGAVKGTAAYMSPEQIKGLPVDARSDLFSLGIMLFEMATWELPFQRHTLLETMHAVAFDETPSVHTRRPNLPATLQRVISRCLRKRPEDRYPEARALLQDLRLLRRDTESGSVRPPSLRERLGDLIDHWTHLRPVQYLWLGGGILGVALVFYLLLTAVSFGSLVSFAVASLLLYRYVRHQPQRMREWFVRKVSRLPEVRLITLQDQRLTVAVDRPIAQLYGRINTYLNQCNRKLFFSPPWSVAIRHDLTDLEIQQMLTSPGVQYVRASAEAEAPKPGHS